MNDQTRSNQGGRGDLRGDPVGREMNARREHLLTKHRRERLTKIESDFPAARAARAKQRRERAVRILWAWIVVLGVAGLILLGIGVTAFVRAAPWRAGGATIQSGLNSMMYSKPIVVIPEPLPLPQPIKGEQG